MYIGVRVVQNRLPQFIQEFQPKTWYATDRAAERMAQLWRDDVRVSIGRGNYDGRNGGEGSTSSGEGKWSHYKDNIFPDHVLMEDDGEEGWSIWTPVWYAEFNEFGGGPLSPRPSAQKAAEQGPEIIAEEYVREFAA